MILWESAKLFSIKKRPLLLRFIIYVKIKYRREQWERYSIRKPKHSAQLAMLVNHKINFKRMEHRVHFVGVVIVGGTTPKGALLIFIAPNYASYAIRKEMRLSQDVEVIFT